MKTNKLKLKARWDKDVVPANRPRKRGLLIKLTGKSDERITRRQGINLALAIDRSGSMGKRNMEAAKEAAIGVVERMQGDDVLSIVDFDSQVTVLLDGAQMTSDGKAEAINAIATLHARASTALGAGWFEAARCASRVIDRTDFRAGNILLISDGRANTGITDPAELSTHAAELADRGVTTSTVGIGRNYSPLQLEALAEGGRGRLHDAEGGPEIIDVIMGELGDTRSIVATDSSVVVRWPEGLRAELMSNFDMTLIENGMIIKVGHLVNGIERVLPLTFDIPGLPAGEKASIEITADARSNDDYTAISKTRRTAIKSLPPADAAKVQRDEAVAEQIARLWQSTQVLEAMRMNERGDFAGAAMLVRESGDEIRHFAADLGAIEDISSSLRVAESRVATSWEGRSKREAMIAAKKFSKGERDHRKGRDGPWDKHLSE